ncbi:MAG: ATP-binding cassette domain-containing protein [Proteobacteria bacterium]|nr:ATP-binding cassette domain-containing protein [Pseudomonadota bacterium]
MVRFDDLTYVYPGKTNGLKNINLNIEKGSFVFICGSTSEYKTTFLNLIYGELLPTSGKLQILDYTLPDDRKKLFQIRAKVGYAFHPLSFFEELTVRENLLIPLYIRNKRDLSKSIDDYIHDMTELNPLSLVKTLSSSEKQKLNLLRAFIIEPLIVLADEPFKYLHKEDTEKWIRFFQNKANSGVTVISTAISHNIPEKFGIKFYTIKNGRLLEENEKQPQSF